MALAKQSDTIINRVLGLGNLIVFQGVRVQAFQGAVERQLYSDASGTPIEIVQTDENGMYEFWIEEGYYTLRFSYSGDPLGSGDYAIFNPRGGNATGVVVNGVWQTFVDLPRLRFTGSGTAIFDARDAQGNVSLAVQSYTISNAVDRIEYPYFGETAVEIRATITGNLTVEII